MILENDDLDSPDGFCLSDTFPFWSNPCFTVYDQSSATMAIVPVQTCTVLLVFLVVSCDGFESWLWKTWKPLSEPFLNLSCAV